MSEQDTVSYHKNGAVYTMAPLPPLDRDPRMVRPYRILGMGGEGFLSLPDAAEAAKLLFAAPPFGFGKRMYIIEVVAALEMEPPPIRVLLRVP